MAVFRPQSENNVCKLNFDDKFFYELPLHEDTNARIANIANEQIKKLKGINDNTPETYNEVYNMMLDALDDILGEGAGADIMSLYSKPSLFDIGDVVAYITTEYKKAYNARLNKYKADGKIPPTIAPVNNRKRGRR